MLVDTVAHHLPRYVTTSQDRPGVQQQHNLRYLARGHRLQLRQKLATTLV